MFFLILQVDEIEELKSFWNRGEGFENPAKVATGSLQSIHCEGPGIPVQLNPKELISCGSFPCYEDLDPDDF